MTTDTLYGLDSPWAPERPRVLVVACSDGRLQEATDEFLAEALDIHRYDRFYIPGGAGALSFARGEFVRVQELRRECRFLIDAHRIDHLILLFHGPGPDGPAEAICADYRKQLPWIDAATVRQQQGEDVRDLMNRQAEYAAAARLSIYRLEVGASGALSVGTLHERARTA